MDNEFWIKAIKSKIPIVFKLVALVLNASVLMSLLSVVFIVFSWTTYYTFWNPNVLDVLQMWTIFAAFYLIIFAAFPTTLIVILAYFTSKPKARDAYQLKRNFKLIAGNLFILLTLFVLMLLKENEWI